MKRHYTWLTCLTLIVTATAVNAQGRYNTIPSDSLGPEIALTTTATTGDLKFATVTDWSFVIDEVVEGELAWAYDADGDSLACEPVVTDLTGKVALIRRGTCTFFQKGKQAQLAGAVAYLIITDDRIAPGGMSSDSMQILNIPGVIVNREIGDQISAAVDAGDNVVATLTPRFDREISSIAPHNYYVIPEAQAGMPLFNSPKAAYYNFSSDDSLFTATLSVTDPNGDTYVAATTTDTIQRGQLEFVLFDNEEVDYDFSAGQGDYTVTIASSLGVEGSQTLKISDNYYQTVPDDAEVFGIQISDQAYSAADSRLNQVMSVYVDETTIARSFGFGICNVEALVQNGRYPAVEVDIIDPDIDLDGLPDFNLTNGFDDLLNTNFDNFIGIGSYEFTGDEACSTMDDMLTIDLESQSGDPDLILEGGKLYLIRLLANSESSGSSSPPAFMSSGTRFVPDVLNPETDFHTLFQVSADMDTIAFNNRYLELDDVTRGFGGIIPVMRLTVDATSSTRDAALAGEFSLSPNPADAFTTLEYVLDVAPGDDVNLTVINSLGQQVWRQSVDGTVRNRIQVPTSAFPVGTYTVRIHADSGVKALPLSVNR